MRDGDTVVQTQHRFDQLVNECIIQALAITENDKTMALLTHPSEKWRVFMDSYATQNPVREVREIFRCDATYWCMKQLNSTQHNHMLKLIRIIIHSLRKPI